VRGLRNLVSVDLKENQTFQKVLEGSVASKQFDDDNAFDYLKEFEARYRSIEEMLKKEIARDVEMEEEKRQVENR